MQIILRGPAAGYEAEHTARLFFPGAEKSENLPQEGDFVLAQSHQCTDLALLRLNGKLQWQTALRPQGDQRLRAVARRNVRLQLAVSHEVIAGEGLRFLFA